MNFMQTQLARLRRHTYNDWLVVLGSDLFIICIAKLDNKSVIACARVCKAYKTAATSNVIWLPRLKADFRVLAGVDLSGLDLYKKEVKKEKERQKRIELERKRQELNSRMDRMVCRMFHPSNGRDNFAPFTPCVPFQDMPSRDVLIKILTRDNELRLTKEIQDDYWVSEYPSLVTLKVQTQAVREFGFENPWIIPSAISYYKDDVAMMDIPHYVKYNRSQPGKIQIGQSVPDLPLTTMQGCGTSLLSSLAPHTSLPVVLVAGSYT